MFLLYKINSIIKQKINKPNKSKKINIKSKWSVSYFDSRTPKKDILTSFDLLNKIQIYKKGLMKSAGCSQQLKLLSG